MNGLFQSTDLVVAQDGEPRMSANLLAERLGMKSKRSMDALIKRNEASLLRFGGFTFTVSENPSPMGGRPTKDYQLNEGQAIFIASKSETAVADEIHIALVQVFMAVRHGRLVPVANTAPVVDPFAAMAGRSGDVRDHLAAIAAMPALARGATHLPIWRNGRRPNWWGHYELRSFLTESHRQMTLAECCAEVQRRFNRPFSASTLQRYWAQLDRAIGPGQRQIPRPSKTKKEAA